MTGSLLVTWDKAPVGALTRLGDAFSADYEFRYEPGAPPISVALPVRPEPYSPMESRPFFEALLPEGTLRESVATQLRLPQSDSFGLLGRLGRDCAGALQILDRERLSDAPAVNWLDDEALAELVVDLPSRPLGMGEDERMRLSLAGVRRKAVLIRDGSGRFGEPLHGMPSTHILKPEPVDTRFPGVAVNEAFCMQLASRCGLPTARTELMTIAGRTALVVERFDRDLATSPARRLHQEDLCQAIGILPGFKYASPERRRPAFADIADLLDRHGSRPGRDRLDAARAAVFVYVTGNADAHGKNFSFLHDGTGRIRLAPLYDLVATAAWEHHDPTMALSIGDEFDPGRISASHFDGLAEAMGLGVPGFRRLRERLVDQIRTEAGELVRTARADGWHDPILDRIVRVIEERSAAVYL